MLAREDYITRLENENIMLRDEIKKAKFNNEKNGYEKFTTGLTVLRKEAKERTTRSLNNAEKNIARTSIDKVSPLRDKISAKLEETAKSRKRLQELQQLEETSNSLKRQTADLKQYQYEDLRNNRGESPIPVLMTHMLDDSIAARRERANQAKNNNTSVISQQPRPGMALEKPSFIRTAASQNSQSINQRNDSNMSFVPNPMSMMQTDQASSSLQTMTNRVEMNKHIHSIHIKETQEDENDDFVQTRQSHMYKQTCEDENSILTGYDQFRSSHGFANANEDFRSS